MRVSSVQKTRSLIAAIVAASCVTHRPNVFRSILKKHGLAAGDFPEIHAFAAKLKETKFQEFHSFSPKMIEDLDRVLETEIPQLMSELPSEKDSPETLRSKLGGDNPSSVSVPIPKVSGKFGKKDDANKGNPFGYDEADEEHYWYVRRMFLKRCSVCLRNGR